MWWVPKVWKDDINRKQLGITYPFEQMFAFFAELLSCYHWQSVLCDKTYRDNHRK